MLITAQQRSMAMKGAELIQAVASLRKNAVSYVSPGIQPRKQVRFWNEKRWTPTSRETIRMGLEYTAAAFGNARIWLRVRPIANHEHKIRRGVPGCTTTERRSHAVHWRWCRWRYFVFLHCCCFWLCCCFLRVVCVIMLLIREQYDSDWIRKITYLWNRHIPRNGRTKKSTGLPNFNNI